MSVRLLANTILSFGHVMVPVILLLPERVRLTLHCCVPQRCHQPVIGRHKKKEKRRRNVKRRSSFCFVLLLSLAYTNCAKASRMRRMASMMFSSLVA